MTKKALSTFHFTPLQISDFLTYQGVPQCSRYEGIKNLLGLLKTDFKKALKHYKFDIPQRTEKLNEVQSLVIPYIANWKEWSGSGFCNLTPFQVSVINLYRKKQDYEWIGRQLEVSYDVVVSTLSKAISRLKSPQTAILFQTWRDFNGLDINNLQDFLDMPLEGLRYVFPDRVYVLLSSFGETMGEALNKMTVKELRTYKNFGSKAEQELKAVLENYRCLHLLR